MEGFSINNTSPNNISHNGTTHDLFSIKVVTCIIVSISLCLTIVAIFAVCSLVRKDHVAPIYLINLLISDLIQLCCLIVWVTEQKGSITYKVGSFLYNVGLMASVDFMVCVALERYLVIAHPLWYRFRHTIKTPVVVCVVFWVFTLVLISSRFWIDFKVYSKMYATYLFLPFPLLIFFLGGTIKALSASRVPSDEKRRIVGILVLVLLIYTLLFLPLIINNFAKGNDYISSNRTFLFVQFSPLADLFLYVFMRKGTIDKLLASVCYCRMDSNDISRMDSNDITSPTV